MMRPRHHAIGRITPFGHQLHGRRRKQSRQAGNGLHRFVLGLGGRGLMCGQEAPIGSHRFLRHSKSLLRARKLQQQVGMLADLIGRIPLRKRITISLLRDVSAGSHDVRSEPIRRLASYRGGRRW